MLEHIWWSLPLTIVVFYLARKLSTTFKLPILNPLLITIAVLIALLVITNTSYEHYFAGSKILDLLQPAVVALAFSTYEQMHQIRAQWKSLLSICFAGSLVAMFSGAAIALWLGQPDIAGSILPKSVTTPIAMAVADSVGGILRLVPLACCLLGS